MFLIVVKAGVLLKRYVPSLFSGLFTIYWAFHKVVNNFWLKLFICFYIKKGLGIHFRIKQCNSKIARYLSNFIKIMDNIFSIWQQWPRRLIVENAAKNSTYTVLFHTRKGQV